MNMSQYSYKSIEQTFNMGDDDIARDVLILMWLRQKMRDGDVPDDFPFIPARHWLEGKRWSATPLLEYASKDASQDAKMILSGMIGPLIKKWKESARGTARLSEQISELARDIRESPHLPMVIRTALADELAVRAFVMGAAERLSYAPSAEFLRTSATIACSSVFQREINLINSQEARKNKKWFNLAEDALVTGIIAYCVSDQNEGVFGNTLASILWMEGKRGHVLRNSAFFRDSLRRAEEVFIVTTSRLADVIRDAHLQGKGPDDLQTELQMRLPDSEAETRSFLHQAVREELRVSSLNKGYLPETQKLLDMQMRQQSPYYQNVLMRLRQACGHTYDRRGAARTVR